MKKLHILSSGNLSGKIWIVLCEAPRPQAGASRKGNIVLIVPLDPAYKAGLAGHLPAKNKNTVGRTISARRIA